MKCYLGAEDTATPKGWVYDLWEQASDFVIDRQKKRLEAGLQPWGFSVELPGGTVAVGEKGFTFTKADGETESVEADTSTPRKSLIEAIRAAGVNVWLTPVVIGALMIGGLALLRALKR